MTDKEKRELTAWWWGRKLPKVYSDLCVESKSDNDFILLKHLKELYEEYAEEGVDVTWGHQLTMKEFAESYV